jgi:Ca2+-binding RTX toxin-like protein
MNLMTAASPRSARVARRAIAALGVPTMVAAGIIAAAPPASADACKYDAGTKTVTLPPGGGSLYANDPICSEPLDQIATVVWPGTALDDTFTFNVVAGTFTPGATPDPDGSPEVKFQLDAGGGSDSIALYGLSTLTYDFVSTDQGLDLNGDGDVDLTFVNVEHLSFRLGTGDDTVDLGAGTPSGMVDAVIEDGPGSDTITGGAEVDWLNPWDGHDAFTGGLGDDTVDVTLDQGGSFHLGTYDGGGGSDTLSFEDGNAGGVIADLATGTAAWGGSEPMTFSGFEGLVGNSGDDTLIGDGGDNVLEVLHGGILRGAGGDDTIISDQGGTVADFGDADGVSIDLAAGTATGDGNDTLAGIEIVAGSPGNDTIIGDDDHSSVIQGEAGNDTISGGPDEDLLIGGPGTDDLRGAGGLDDLHGGPGKDLMVGGNDGDDFSGGSGHDDIRGGPGADSWNASLFSMGEQDEHPTEGASVDLATGIVADDGFGTSDAISGIEEVTGTFFADTLIGDSGNNAINGSSGNDRLVGGAGNDELQGATGRDTVSFASASHALDVDLTHGTATGLGDDTLDGIEVVIGGPEGDTLRGSAADERLEGHAGDDLLFGRAGGDALVGGPGADAMDGGLGHDTCNGGNGHDDTARECEIVWRVP